jgi:hypothetical protein
MSCLVELIREIASCLGRGTITADRIEFGFGALIAYPIFLGRETVFDANWVKILKYLLSGCVSFNELGILSLFDLEYPFLVAV